MLLRAASFFVGGERLPVDGPFCVHAAMVVDPVVAAQTFAVGVAAPDDDQANAFVTVVGQVYAPGFARLVNDQPAVQFACEDD